MIRGYQDLEVWQRSMDLAVLCYRVTNRFPRGEQYGLTLQLRKAAGSVPANIAEGRGRRSTREFLHFLSIANGSLMELEIHIVLAERLSYVVEADTSEVLRMSAEVGRMLNGLRGSLEARIRSQSDPRPPTPDP